MSIASYTQFLNKTKSPENTASRLQIHNTMLKKTFHHYKAILARLKHAIEDVKHKNRYGEDTSPFTRVLVPTESKELIFWKAEVPTYETAGKQNAPAIKPKFMTFIKEFGKDSIDKAIEAVVNNDKLTEQIVLLVKILIRSYIYDTGKYILPIHMNVDRVWTNTDTNWKGLGMEKIRDAIINKIKKMASLGAIATATSNIFSKVNTGDLSSIPQTLETLGDSMSNTMEETATDVFAEATADFKKDNMVNILSAPLAGAGPMMVKLLQQFSTRNYSEVMDGMTVEDISEDIFDNVPGLTSAECHSLQEQYRTALLHKVRKKDGTFPPDRKLTSVIRVDGMCTRKVQSGSVGDTYETSIQGKKNQKVIVKVLKPIYLFYFLCECNLVLVHCWNLISDLSAQHYSHITDMDKRRRMALQVKQLLCRTIYDMLDEFDYENEWSWTGTGKIAYSEYFKTWNKRDLVKGFDTPSPIALSLNPMPVMAIEKIRGISVKKFLLTNKSYDHAYEVYRHASRLRDLWIHNIFLERNNPTIRGFFHADLHAGNLYCDIKKNRVRLNIIDFGSCGRLQAEEARELLAAMALMPTKNEFQKVSKLIEEVHGLFPNTVHNKIEQRKRKYLGIKWRPDHTPLAKRDPTNLLHYFHSLPSFSKAQIDIMQKRIRKDPNVLQAHKNNVRAMRFFIRQLYKICSGHDNQPIPDQLIVNVLNYDDYLVDFGSMFLRIFKYGTDMDKCIDSSTVTFGKGVLYISQLIQSLRNHCIDISPTQAKRDIPIIPLKLSLWDLVLTGMHFKTKVITKIIKRHLWSS